MPTRTPITGPRTRRPRRKRLNVAVLATIFLIALAAFVVYGVIVEVI